VLPVPSRELDVDELPGTRGDEACFFAVRYISIELGALVVENGFQTKTNHAAAFVYQLDSFHGRLVHDLGSEI
jgi:hypothetical protein